MWSVKFLNNETPKSTVGHMHMNTLWTCKLLNIINQFQSDEKLPKSQSCGEAHAALNLKNERWYLKKGRVTLPFMCLMIMRKVTFQFYTIIHWILCDTICWNPKHCSVYSKIIRNTLYSLQLRSEWTMKQRWRIHTFNHHVPIILNFVRSTKHTLLFPAAQF